LKSQHPSAKGPFFYFYVESSSSIFMHWLREHSCHEYNVHSPKIYYWLIMVLLVVTSQVFIKFWNKFFCFVLFVLIKISQGFKTFWVDFEALLEKLFQTFYDFLKNYFEKIQFQNTIKYLSKPMQAYLHRKHLPNGLY
jgi:hypothetical protein